MSMVTPLNLEKESVAIFFAIKKPTYSYMPKIKQKGKLKQI